MQALVLGGTQFVGRHIAEALLAAGHGVSVFTRGQSPDALPAAVERLRGDRDVGAPGLASLAGRHWDVCIDVSGYTPAQVRASAEALRDRVTHCVFISAVMVYGDTRTRPVDETQARVPPAADDVHDVDGQTYGPLKVRCEDIVQQVFGSRATLLRPQVVVGPHDPTGRYAYWLHRAARGGTVLAPGDGSDHLQCIDVHDLARFVAHVAAQRLPGAYNLAGPRLTWADFLSLLGARDLAWVPATLLQAEGVGFQQLPLYRPENGALAGLMDVSAARAIAAGLRLTDAADTLRAIRAAGPLAPLATALSPQREAALIAAAGAATSSDRRR